MQGGGGVAGPARVTTGALPCASVTAPGICRGRGSGEEIGSACGSVVHGPLHGNTGPSSPSQLFWRLHDSCHHCGRRRQVGALVLSLRKDPQRVFY